MFRGEVCLNVEEKKIWVVREGDWWDNCFWGFGGFWGGLGGGMRGFFCGGMV